MIELRPATADDAALLLRWRSEPSTVAASFAPAVPTPAEHARWLAGVLADPSRRLWIVLADGEPVGQVRLDPAEDPDDGEEISVSIAEAARGRGLATAAIRAACELGAGPVVARVRPGNTRSVAAFTAAGFVTQPGTPTTLVLRWSPPALTDPAPP